MCVCSILNIFDNKFCKSSVSGVVLSNLRQVISQFPLFDDEVVFLTYLDQPKFAEFVHEDADAGARCSDHLRQFFVCDLVFDADAARVLLAELASQS